MIRNYFVVSFRSLWKNRSYTIINVIGLALGLSCAIIIFLIIRFELSFDRHYPDGDRIFRVVTEYTPIGEHAFFSGATYPLPQAMREDLSGLEHVVLVDSNLDDPVFTITHGSGVVDRYKEDKVAFVDPEYFEVFPQHWIIGHKSVFKNEKVVVLTSEIAEKYFGDEPALGKVISFNNEFDVTIVGVIQDPPMQTDLPFQILISTNVGSIKRGWENWTTASLGVNCYVKLVKGVTQRDFESKMKGWHMKYFTGKDEEDGRNRRYFLQPLSEVHFDTRFENVGKRLVSKNKLMSLAAIGVLLILTASVNFINLNTVLMIKRSREAGVRKVLGSTHQQLITRVIGETFVITVMSLVIAIGISEVLLINMGPVIGYHLSITSLLNVDTIGYLFLLIVVVTLLAGLYPALQLSRFQPVQTLKSSLASGHGEGRTLRLGLISFQLLVSQVLIVATLIIVEQINYVMSIPLGLNSESVVEFHLPERKRELLHSLSERIQQLQGVQSVTMSNTGTISSDAWTGDFEAAVNGQYVKEETQVKFVDANYVSTYGLTLVAGENLLPSDTVNRFLVNEKFVQALGLQQPEEAIGVPIEIWSRKALIQGVARDFHSTSLHEAMMPVIIMTETKNCATGAVRLDTKNISETLAKIQSVWEDLYPNYIFEYTFLDDSIGKFYDNEKRNSYIMAAFTMVAVLIGCIGLFGLISFMVQQKLKEIGIRKTFGASVGQIVQLLSREFVMLIIVSFVLAIPVIYFFMEKWLSNFAYRMEITAFEFLVGLLAIFLISGITVGYRSVRAAMSKPVDILRVE